MTPEELAAEFDAHAKEAMVQYNATDWNSKNKRAAMIAKAQTWQKAAGLVRNAILVPTFAEVETLRAELVNMEALRDGDAHALRQLDAGLTAANAEIARLKNHDLVTVEGRTK